MAGSESFRDAEPGVLLLRVSAWSAGLTSAWLDEIARDEVVEAPAVAAPPAADDAAGGAGSTGGSHSTSTADGMGALLKLLQRETKWGKHARVARAAPLVRVWKPEAPEPMPPRLLTSFRECSPDAAREQPMSAEQEQEAAQQLARPEAVRRARSMACERAMMSAFTMTDDSALVALAAEHAAPGSVHVRPIERGEAAGAAGSWLPNHRGRLGSCLPRLLIVGSQRSGLASLHTWLKRGWHSQLKVASGERDLHFFSMDNRFKEGLLQYQRRFYPGSTRLRECAPSSHFGVDVSSTYFDYPKAPGRIFAILPWSRIVVLLRAPVERALSAYNLRWLTWLCGKAIWARDDCWTSLTSEESVRSNQVGPFQMHAALKLYRSCADKHGVLRLRCLQKDYVTKLRNKTASEVELLQVRVCDAQGQERRGGLGACGES